MEQLPFIKRADLDAAAAAVLRILRGDGVILIPTESFYGLAANPFSVVAVERVMALKGRPRGIPLPVLAADWRQVEDLVEIPRGFRSYLERSWPGPLTAVLPSLYGPAASPGGTVAVRIPGHPLLRQLLAGTGPLTGTSANRHKMAPSVTVAGALASLEAKPDLVLNGGETTGGAPTILVDLSAETPRILRPGRPTSSGRKFGK